VNQPRTYTNHALERMRERSLTIPMVEAVLRAGEIEPDLDGFGVRATLCGITVVVDAYHGAIVTVFDRRNPPARISPKRLARKPGQFRRRFERNRTTNGGWQC